MHQHRGQHEKDARDRVVQEFREGTTKVLISTDVLSAALTSPRSDTGTVWQCCIVCTSGLPRFDDTLGLDR